MRPNTTAGTDDGPADLVVLAPSAEQRRDRAWVSGAARVAAERLSPRGIAYVLTRAPLPGGLRAEATILHLPSVEQSRYLAPVGSTAERYALSGMLPMKPVKRLAAIGLQPRGRALLGPTATIHTSTRAEPLMRWLFELDAPGNPPGSALVSLTRKGTVLHRFAPGEATPNGVAKVSSRADDDLRGLSAIAPGAAREGARVPGILAYGDLRSTPLVLQSVVAGRSATLLLASGRLAVADLQRRIAEWLQRWGSSSVHLRVLETRDLERFLHSPAERCRLAADRRTAYLDYLRELASRAVGAACPFVPGHGDLTAANLLIDDGQDALGVVDWEGATERSLPLMDFFYAMADAAAAKTRYLSRPAAFDACFAGGADAGFVDGLRRRLGDGLGAGGLVQEVAFHACWLHHAANEASRTPDAQAGPFATILGRIARDPARFERPQQT